MLAFLKRWLALDLKHTARALEQRIAALEALPGPDRAISELTKGKGE